MLNSYWTFNWIDIHNVIWTLEDVVLEGTSQRGLASRHRCHGKAREHPPGAAPCLLPSAGGESGREVEWLCLESAVWGAHMCTMNPDLMSASDHQLWNVPVFLANNSTLETFYQELIFNSYGTKPLTIIAVLNQVPDM